MRVAPLSLPQPLPRLGAPRRAFACTGAARRSRVAWHWAHLLFDVKDLQALGHALKFVRGEEFEEGGLADAVAPDEAILAPMHEGHVHLVEQQQAVEVHRDALEKDVDAAGASAAALPVQHDGLARELPHEFVARHAAHLLAPGVSFELLLAASLLLEPSRHRLLALVLLDERVHWAAVRDRSVVVDAHFADLRLRVRDRLGLVCRDQRVHAHAVAIQLLEFGRGRRGWCHAAT